MAEMEFCKMPCTHFAGFSAIFLQWLYREAMEVRAQRTDRKRDPVCVVLESVACLLVSLHSPTFRVDKAVFFFGIRADIGASNSVKYKFKRILLGRH